MKPLAPRAALVFLGVLSFTTAAFPQTTRSWTTTAPDGNSGAWSDAAKWGGNVPDTAAENANFGAYANARTVTVDGTAYTINQMTITPRNSGFSGMGFTFNASGGGSLAIGAGGVRIDNGNTVSINVPIEVTANQTWTGLTNSPGGNAIFSGTISGVGAITRTATNASIFVLTGANTFTGGFVNASQVTSLGSSSNALLSAGPVGSGTLRLNGGTLTSYANAGRTIHNNVEIGGNITLGSTSTTTIDQRGALAFEVAAGGSSFNLHSSASNISRTITTASAITVNQGIGEAGGGTNLGLTKAGTQTLTMGGTNSYTGDTLVSAGTLILGSTSSQRFAIGDADATQIFGAGTANFNGEFRLDLSAVTTANNSWSLVDTGTLFESFGSTFSVVDHAGLLTFTQASDVWTASNGGATWTFTEGTGVLTLTTVPEPSVTLLVAAAALGFGTMRRRGAVGHSKETRE